MTTLSIDLQYHFDLYSLPAVPEGLFAKKISVSYDEESQEKTNWYFIQYVKHLLCETTYRTHGLFRSVLTDGKKIHVFSPPKSIPFALIKNENYDDFKLEELVEGTMINLFWNNYLSDWELATKGSLGGRYSFYQDNKKTFRTMFLEALNYQHIELENLNKELCYSFILQHPENRIVISFKNPRVVLAAIYKIEGTKITILDKTACNIPNVILPKTSSHYTNYNGSNWEDLQSYFSQMNLDYRVVGVNIYNPKTGLRSKIRNPTYEHVRRLKGNSPKIQFQYYSLRQVGKVGEFLRYYNEFRPKFTELRKDLHQWTDQLWKNYVRCYVQKEKPLLEFPKKFRVHMFNLHQIYLNDLRDLGHYISRQIVIKYINSLEPAKLMYSINYDLRRCETNKKKNKGEINVQ